MAKLMLALRVKDTNRWVPKWPTELYNMASRFDVPRMRPLYYVSSRLSLVWPCNKAPYMKLNEIVAERPEDYRYVVVEPKSDYDILTWLVDLYDLQLSGEYLTTLSLGWHKSYPTTDAAIMAAMIRGDVDAWR